MPIRTSLVNCGFWYVSRQMKRTDTGDCVGPVVIARMGYQGVAAGAPKWGAGRPKVLVLRRCSRVLRWDRRAGRRRSGCALGAGVADGGGEGIETLGRVLLHFCPPGMYPHGYFSMIPQAEVLSIAKNLLKYMGFELISFGCRLCYSIWRVSVRRSAFARIGAWCVSSLSCSTSVCASSRAASTSLMFLIASMPRSVSPDWRAP